MAISILNNESNQVLDSKDSIVIITALTDIPAGKTLDVSGVVSGTKTLQAGHVIIKNSAGEYQPLGVSDSEYVSLQSGETYVGVLKHSILVSDPRAAIVTSGQINAAASPYPVTDTIKAGLPLIQFMY